MRAVFRPRVRRPQIKKHWVKMIRLKNSSISSSSTKLIRAFQPLTHSKEAKGAQAPF